MIHCCMQKKLDDAEQVLIWLRNQEPEEPSLPATTRFGGRGIFNPLFMPYQPIRGINLPIPRQKDLK